MHENLGCYSCIEMVSDNATRLMLIGLKYFFKKEFYIGKFTRVYRYCFFCLSRFSFLSKSLKK